MGDDLYLCLDTATPTARVAILDGGLLVFFTLELFKRRPPSPRARQLATKVGLVIVVGLTVLALRNDVVRFLLGDR